MLRLAYTRMLIKRLRRLNFGQSRSLLLTDYLSHSSRHCFISENSGRLMEFRSATCFDDARSGKDGLHRLMEQNTYSDVSLMSCDLKHKLFI